MISGRKITASGAWKSLQIDEHLRNEGLVGIEELSNYSLVKVRKKVTKNGTQKEQDPDQATKKKKKKNRKKKKKKKVVETISQEDTEQVEEDASSEDDDDDQEEAVQPDLGVKRKNETEKAKPKTKKQKKEPGEEVLAPQSDEDEQLLEDVEATTDVSLWRDLFVPAPILDALRDLGFKDPTPIQRETLPAAIKGRRDIVGAAETGSGKTLAFGIPMLHGIMVDQANEVSEEISELDSEEEVAMEDDNDEEETGCVKVMTNVDFDFEVDESQVYPEFKLPDAPKKPSKLRGLILTPTRELAIQVKNHLVAVAKYTNIKIAVVVGGMSSQKQERVLKKGPEIVVATPGRLWDLIQTGNPHLSQVNDIRYLAIDETDRMVEKGHFEELQQLLEMINTDQEKLKLRQTFVFSATLTMIHELPKHLRQNKKSKSLTTEEKLAQVTSMIGLKPKPKIVDLTRKVGTAETLTESCIHCSTTEKDFFLYYFLQQHPGRTLVFCNSIDCVRRLVNLFGLMKCESLGLHAQMHQKQRLKNLERFSANPRGVLLATDVAARGLDIPDVEHVVHYQVPRTSESYVHRSGRTARASKEGLSVMMIDPSENHFYRRMCKTLNRADELPSFPIDSTMMPVVRERVSKARELDKLMLAARKEDVQKSWRRKAAEEAELEISDSSEDENFANSAQKTSMRKTSIQTKKLELASLLSTPIYGMGFSGKYPTMSGKLNMPNIIDKDSKMKSALTKIKTESQERKRILKKKMVGLKSNVLLKHKKKKKSKKN